MKRLGFIFTALFLLFLVSTITADVKLPAIIGSNMVLQQGINVSIWGTADPGERVIVTFGEQLAETITDCNGEWMIKLNPMKAGGPFEMTITGNNTIILSNILIGEVWVGSGQSNMGFLVKQSNNAKEEIANAKYPTIRLFTVKRTIADKPQKDTEGQWLECNPETVGNFSAVAYFFGREIYKDMNVPVGLINSSWGGTEIEAWMCQAKLYSDPEFRPVLDRYKRALAVYPEAKMKYESDMKEWVKNAEKVKKEGKRPQNPPGRPLGPENPHSPSGLYNGMITPIIPFAIKGVIWYQGEANADRAYQYRKLFPAMIQNWRCEWKEGDFPFLFVQLAYFKEVETYTAGDDWAELREAQTMTLSLPKTAMAVTIDIGEEFDIHPKNKQDVGKRLYLGAKAIAYGKNVVYSGPIYESTTVEGDKIRLRFKYVDGGLMTKNKEPLKGFTIAGENREFVPAEAKIDGNEILVWSGKVSNPIAVRYGWACNPICNLYNKAELPASPFRTDEWPGITINER